MTQLFQVIKYKDIPYETYNKDVIFTSLDLDTAIEEAKTATKEIFFNRVAFQKDTSMFLANFYSIPEMAIMIDGLFKRFRGYGEDSIYVVSVNLNERVNYKKIDIKQAVWSIDEQFVFEMFAEQVNGIMTRDNMPMLQEVDLNELWDRFKHDSRIFDTGYQTNARSRDFKEYILRTKNGAEIWAMTASNDDDWNIYNKFEK